MKIRFEKSVVLDTDSVPNTEFQYCLYIASFLCIKLTYAPSPLLNSKSMTTRLCFMTKDK